MVKDSVSLYPTERTANGWAVVDEFGRLLVHTVSPTRRAAIVNWLCTERAVPLRNDVTDVQIERLWDKLHSNAKAIKVVIEPV